MKKAFRTILAVILCVSGLLLVVLPATNLQAAGIQKGDFVIDGSVLVSYTGRSMELTIPDNVTRIGKEAFSGNSALRSVVIPSSVETIDYAAFEKCINLQDVTISNSVRTIGSSAFSGCTSLRSIQIPDRVSSIGSGAFAGCTSLSDIAVSPSNSNYICQDGVLYSGDGKKIIQYLAGRPATTYTMPSTIEAMEEYAFWGANNLTGVSISNKITQIPEYAFANCPGLTTIVIPNSVTRIHAFAFADCPNLKSAVIPRSVGIIDENAFYMSDGVEVQLTDPSGMNSTVTSSGNSSIVSSAASSNVNSGNITESTTGNTVGNTINDTGESNIGSVYDYSYSTGTSNSTDYESNITPGELGSTKVVGGNAVLLMNPKWEPKGYNLNTAELEDSINQSSSYTTLNTEPFSIINGKLDRYNGNDNVVNIPQNVDTLGNRCFYRNSNLDTVTFSKAPEEIGDFAFARSTITSITVPEGTKQIGYAAFYQCANLSEVSIPNSVTSIELGAFLGTPYLTNWQNTADSNNYLVVGDGILLSYKGDGGNISIPEGVKTIASGCFSGNTSITGVSFPTSLEKIGEDAFNGCSALNTLSLSPGLTTIEDRAFYDTALSTLSIPANVKNIGLGAFAIQKDAPLQTVLFMGKDMPNITYKPTATRLSAKDLRVSAFEGIENAVVRENASIDSGDVFSTDKLGFRGCIYSLDPDQTSEKNTLHLIRCNKEPDENGIVSIDPHVSIGQTNYIMSGVKEHAFDSYLSSTPWYEHSLTDVRIDGNTSEGLDGILSSIPTVTKQVYDENNAISVINNATGFSNNAQAGAKISGNTTPYILTIDNYKSSDGDLSAAFQNAFGHGMDASTYPFTMMLSDNRSGVPITKLNTDKIEIQLPIPTNLSGSTDLTVVTLNDNGALETLSTAVEGDTVSFVGSHFSAYAITKSVTLYSGNITVLNDGSLPGEDAILDQDLNNAMDYFKLNASGGTLSRNGFKITSISIIGAVLFLCGIIIFITNRKRVSQKNH